LPAQRAIHDARQDLVEAGEQALGHAEQPLGCGPAQKVDQRFGHRDGSSIATPSAAFRAHSAAPFIAVRVARGAKYVTRTGPSASSRRSASLKPRSANLLAQ